MTASDTKNLCSYLLFNSTKKNKPIYVFRNLIVTWKVFSKIIFIFTNYIRERFCAKQAPKSLRLDIIAKMNLQTKHNFEKVKIWAYTCRARKETSENEFSSKIIAVVLKLMLSCFGELSIIIVSEDTAKFAIFNESLYALPTVTPKCNNKHDDKIKCYLQRRKKYQSFIS